MIDQREQHHSGPGYAEWERGRRAREERAAWAVGGRERARRSASPSHCGNGRRAVGTRGGCVGKLEWTRRRSAAAGHGSWWLRLPQSAAGTWDVGRDGNVTRVCHLGVGSGIQDSGWDDAQRREGADERRRQCENGVFRGGTGGYHSDQAPPPRTRLQIANRADGSAQWRRPSGGARTGAQPVSLAPHGSSRAHGRLPDPAPGYPLAFWNSAPQMWLARTDRWGPASGGTDRRFDRAERSRARLRIPVVELDSFRSRVAVARHVRGWGPPTPRGRTYSCWRNLVHPSDPGGAHSTLVSRS